MTTTKSYSDAGRMWHLYRTALRQQLPFCIVSAILMGLSIPLVYLIFLLEMNRYGWRDFTLTQSVRDTFSSGVYLDPAQGGFVLFLLMALAIVCALVSNAYLHNKKTVDLYHALPVKREHLMTANLLSSLTVIFAPYLAMILGTMAAQLITFGGRLAGFGDYYLYMLVDIGGNLLAVLTVYLFTTFVAVNVGTVFDAFALTGILGLLPLVVYAIGYAIWESLTYGADSSMDYIFWLSPFSYAFNRYEYIYSIADMDAQQLWKFLLMEGIWLAVTAALFFGTVVQYRRRKSEIAEQTQTAGVFQTIAKSFAGFCGGAVFFAIFYDLENYVAWFFAIVIGAVVIGLVAEIIFSRGVRSIKKNVKWLALSGCLVFVLVIGASLDLFGYVSRVPDPQRLQSASVNYMGRFAYLAEGTYYSSYGYDGASYSMATEAESLAIITDAHRTIVQERPEVFEGNRGGYEQQTTHPYHWLGFTYTYRNGSRMSRQYNELAREGYLRLADLENQAEFIRRRHPLFYLDELTASEKTVDALAGVTTHNAYGAVGSARSLTGTEMAKLVDAVREDLLAESLAGLKNPTASAHGTLEFRFRSDLEVQDENDMYLEAPTRCYVVVTAEYKKTIAVLKELDFWDAMIALPEVDRVYMSSIHNGVGEVDQVVALTPEAQMRNQLQGMEDYVSDTVLDDPAVVKAVVAAGRNQMLVQDFGMEADAIMVSYYADETHVGAQMVRMEDLPKEAREAWNQWNGNEEFATAEAIEVPVDAEYPAPVSHEVSVASEAELNHQLA